MLFFLISEILMLSTLRVSSVDPGHTSEGFMPDPSLDGGPADANSANNGSIFNSEFMNSGSTQSINGTSVRLDFYPADCESPMFFDERLFRASEDYRFLAHFDEEIEVESVQLIVFEPESIRSLDYYLLPDRESGNIYLLEDFTAEVPTKNGHKTFKLLFETRQGQFCSVSIQDGTLGVQTGNPFDVDSNAIANSEQNFNGVRSKNEDSPCGSIRTSNKNPPTVSLLLFLVFSLSSLLICRRSPKNVLVYISSGEASE